ncbi:MAG: GTPase Era [bacterium]
MSLTEADDTKCGFVTVLGAPNAGKSTLVNQMVGAKVSIVTHKVQTTRAQIRGIALYGTTQIIFIDTPGIFIPKRRLDRAMVKAAWEGTEGADICLLLVDAPAYLNALNDQGDRAAKRAREDTDLIIDGLKKTEQQAVLVLNKIDLMAREQLLQLTEHLNKEPCFTETFMISAVKKYGCEQLRDYLIESAKISPWMYPEDQLSDINDRLLTAEITREKLFLRLHQEIPYSLTVETERWERTKKGELRIEQIIYVERDGQKALVLGLKGETIKLIGQLAREEMQEILGEKVHLFLFVKVRSKWSDDPARYREMGLDIGD